MSGARGGAALTVERLQEQLRGDRPLAPTYFLHGEEPLQLLECADALRERAAREGVAERLVFDAQTGIEWQTVLEALGTLSLFASRRLLEIRLGERKPDKEGTEALERLASRPPGDDIVLITAGKADVNARKARWFRLLEEHALCVTSRDLRGPALVAWLERRAARFGKRLSAAAAGLIAERVEGNLLAAAQEVEKLCLVVDGPVIDEEEVLHAVGDSARYDVFQLVDAMTAGDAVRALRILRGLREEGMEPVLVNWALGRELRQLTAMAGAHARGTPLDTVLEQYRVWSTRKPAVRRTLGRLRGDDLSTLLAYANFIDTVIKGARTGEPWDELEILVVNASGRPGCGGLFRRIRNE
jgi:DNA polymerase-3 subunit delta